MSQNAKTCIVDVCNGELTGNVKPHVLPEVTAQIITNNRDKDNRDKRTASLYAIPLSTTQSSQLAKVNDPDQIKVKRTCSDVRHEISQSRQLVSNEQLSFMRLSLAKMTGVPSSLTMNVDLRLNSTPPNTFNRFVFNLSDRGRDFKRGIKDKFVDWESDPSYSRCDDYFLSLKDAGNLVWIGKGRERGIYKAGCSAKTPIVDFMCMVVYFDGHQFRGRFYFEDSEVDFTINEEGKAKHFHGHCTAITHPDKASNKVTMLK